MTIQLNSPLASPLDSIHLIQGTLSFILIELTKWHWFLSCFNLSNFKFVFLQLSFHFRRLSVDNAAVTARSPVHAQVPPFVTFWNLITCPFAVESWNTIFCSFDSHIVQGRITSEEEIQKLVSMGFERVGPCFVHLKRHFNFGSWVLSHLVAWGRYLSTRSRLKMWYHYLKQECTLDKDIDTNFAVGMLQTQVEVAIAAADGDLNVAVEILMSQQVRYSWTQRSNLLQCRASNLTVSAFACRVESQTTEQFLSKE